MSLALVRFAFSQVYCGCGTAPFQSRLGVLGPAPLQSRLGLLGCVCGLLAHLAAGLPAVGALRLVETIPGVDFNIGQSTIEQSVFGTTLEPVHGVGLTARWTAVVADQGGGTFPWSIDLSAQVIAPDGVSTLNWPQIGGDVTTADYPLQDAAGGFSGVSGVGEFLWLFNDVAPAPYVAGLREVEYHLLTFVPDVEVETSATTAGGPLWDRPFFIAGISSLGPVRYHAVQFTPAVAGAYTFVSRVSNQDNFNFIYQDGFDAADPLADLLDYGLGNGNAPNGTPRGTSRIDVLLRPNRTYAYVTSQWSASTPALPFTTTVIGPQELVSVCISCPQGDFDGDGAVDAGDLAIFVDCLSGPNALPAPSATGASSDQCLIAFDFDDDQDVDLHDYAAWMAVAGGGS
jgi:hypothetical protein